MTGRRRLLGGLLIGAWGWWALGWAFDLSTVSPIHWASLAPRFLIEAIPATFGAVTAALLVIDSRRARHLAWLFALTAVHSAIVAAAVPDLALRYHETLRQSRGVQELPARVPVPVELTDRPARFESGPATAPAPRAREIDDAR